MVKRKNLGNGNRNVLEALIKNNFCQYLFNREALGLPLAVFGIILFGLFLRLLFFGGMGTSDDLAYSKFAAEFPSGEPEESTLYTRMGIILPTALSYHLFGINDFSSILFVLLCALGMICLAYHFGMLLFSKEVGMMSAFLMAIFPMDIVYSTRLLSDLPSAFFMSLGVYAFLYAEIRKEGRSPLLFILSGFLIGVGYFIRESALLIGLFFLCYGCWKLLTSRKINWRHLLVGVGLLFALALQSIFFYHLTGEASFRERASQAHLERALISLDNFGRGDLPKGLFHYPYLFLTNELLNIFYFFVFIALLYFVWKREENATILLLWIVPLLLWLSFGTSSFHGYYPFKAADRYVSIVTIPALLILAAFLMENRRRFNGKMVPLILIILLLSSIIGPQIYGNRHLLDNLKEMAPYLKGIDAPIYTDERSAKALAYIYGYESPSSITPYPSGSFSKGSYLLVNTFMIGELRKARKTDTFPKEVDSVPSEWKKISQASDGKVTLYHIP